MTNTDDTSPFPAPAYLVHTLERSRFKGHQLQGFDGCDVVWAIWLPEDDDGRSDPPRIFARVVRGRDIDPATSCNHGAQMVGSEGDAFDLQGYLAGAIGRELQIAADSNQMGTSPRPYGSARMRDRPDIGNI